MYDEILVNGIDNFERKIEDYATLIVKAGINFQKGWALGVCCPTVCPDLARAITKVAYQQGARDVWVFWADPYVERESFMNSEMKFLENLNPWPDRGRARFGDHDMAFVIIECSITHLMKDISIDRQLKYSESIEAEFASFKRGLKYTYSICEASSLETGQKIFPNLSPSEAYIKLWNDIFSFVRVDGKSDPVENWLNHAKTVDITAKKLNELNFKSLHFTSELGTDVTFELPKKHKWMASAVNTSTLGYTFSTNIPTEEVFTIPLKTGVNGKIVSSRTMVAKSGEVEALSLELKDGKIVDFSADKGYDLIKTIMDSHPNGYFMGEVAIVPYDTPISRSGNTYYTTLIDENSGCHTAIGNSYSKCIEGGLQMTNEQLEAEGLNICSFHEDVVFGTAETKIVGTTYDGQEITIFEHGSFVI